MGKRNTYWGSTFNGILTPSEIFGANYYEDWDFDNASSLNLTGSLINSITSTGLNGGLFTESGANRPSLITDAIIGKDVAEFDGVGEFMRVLGSEGDYNFLHDGSGGCVIIVQKMLSAPTLLGFTLINGFGAGSTGFRNQITNPLTSNSVVSNGVSNSIINASSNAVTLNTYASNVLTFDADNATAADRAEVILNGTSTKANTQTAAPSVANADKPLTMGVRADSLAGFFLHGTIARVIVADIDPSALQLSQLQTYLDSHYGTFPIS